MIVTVKIVALVKTDNNQYGWLIEQSLEKCKNIVGEGTFLFVETKKLPVPIKIKDGKYVDLCDSEWHIVRKNLQYTRLIIYAILYSISEKILYIGFFCIHL